MIQSQKKCFKCKQIKHLSEYYNHKNMADGHLNKCIECTKKDVRLHRQNNIDRIREYDRKRGKLPSRIKSCQKRNKIRRRRFPIKFAARYILANALRAKKINKPSVCSMCGRKARIYGHHNDYYKPLEVIWVCQVCHINQFHHAYD